jgi:DNA helicase-2/ATP-dependent DNA helicase PcrA
MLGMNTINKLNPKQKEAALHKDGPLLILAGAGSGKTNTMIHRIAHLIKDEGIGSQQILAVTFTNKAAAEMRDRLEGLIGGGLRMWILTFHSACLRILRRHAHLLGYDKDFVVYDPTDQKVVVRNIVKSHNLDDKKYTPNYVLNVISANKDRGKRAEDYALEKRDSPLRETLSVLYSDYERTLKKNNAMDFDDLIMNAVLLFTQRDDVLKEYQERFRYVLVDEYQDTNYMQYRFVRLLAEKHRNICVVGDDDQCIYQWRGADITNILDFEKDFKGTKVIKLEQNYRSHANILNGANSVIVNNKTRKQKTLWTDNESGDKIRFQSTYDEKEEARFVAGEIHKGISEGRNYRDFAILYRTNAQSRNFEEAFSASSIPYQVLGGLRYYDRKEIKDMLAYMRLAQNPADDLSLTRIINEPKRGIGAKTLEKLIAFASARGCSLLEILRDEDALESLSVKVRNAVVALTTVLDLYSGSLEEYRIADLYDGLMVRSGYLKALEDQRTVEAESRIENLLEFKSVISQYETEDPEITLAEFMEKIALISDIDNHDRDENAVTLMTLHSAKGLEFPVVFMVGMEEGLFPGVRSMESAGGVEEERRLCYVGMTRAREKLYLTRAGARTIYGKYSTTIESRFLREIDTDFMEGVENIGQDTTGYFHKPMGANDGFSHTEIFRPFDQLRQIKESVAKATGGLGAGATGNYEKGDRVRHKKFGEGLVLETDERVVIVMFDQVGKKKMARDIAPLERL